MRRREQAAWQRLTWFGARRWQIVLLASLQALVLAGRRRRSAGWALGVLATTVIASRADLPEWELVRNALFTSEMLVVLVALTAAAALALLAALLTSRVRVGGRSFTTFDMAAVGALAALVLVLALQGDANADGSAGPLLLAPGLALFVAAYVDGPRAGAADPHAAAAARPLGVPAAAGGALDRALSRPGRRRGGVPRRQRRARGVRAALRDHARERHRRPGGLRRARGLPRLARPRRARHAARRRRARPLPRAGARDEGDAGAARAGQRLQRSRARTS